ncbi:MAG: pyrroloquinoline-quinone synthase PqqC [Alphaproteobacteria bacterium]|nr:pyrroloquinoline-quinone synthase PqqC [Alphaproteobacteria bacterium]
MMQPRTETELEAELRAIGAARYHHLHPFHALLHEGKLSKEQVQAWALNRYVYQSRIPIKDASLIARCEDKDLRRIWRQRLIDHDGMAPGEGGIERWLKLTDDLGLRREAVTTMRLALPATRFAVDAYVAFVRERSLLEAVASSLTELFSPDIIRTRMAGMLASYPFVSKETLAYFEARTSEAPRDADFALAYVKRNAKTRELQELVLEALRFKCGVLWAQLDALYYAYVSPGDPPPGTFLSKRS